jgi:hypothetical protein
VSYAQVKVVQINRAFDERLLCLDVNDGKLEIAQRMAKHETASTTDLYDRRTTSSRSMKLKGFFFETRHTVWCVDKNSQ